MAVGPGKYSDKGDLIPMPVKEGDIVVFAKYSGTELKLDGEDYLVLAGSPTSSVSSPESDPLRWSTCFLTIGSSE